MNLYFAVDLFLGVRDGYGLLNRRSLNTNIAYSSRFGVWIFIVFLKLLGLWRGGRVSLFLMAFVLSFVYSLLVPLLLIVLKYF